MPKLVEDIKKRLIKEADDETKIAAPSPEKEDEDEAKDEVVLTAEADDKEDDSLPFDDEKKAEVSESDDADADDAKSDKEDEKEDDEKVVAEETVEPTIAPLKVEDYKISAKDVDVTEDVAAILTGGKNLSESFKKKVATVYKSAVVAKINETIERLAEDANKAIGEEREKIYEGMVDKIDLYMDKAMTEWYEANKVEVEGKIRLQIAESFMAGLKTLFEQHYIDMPKGKEDIFESMVRENSKLEEAVNAEAAKNARLLREINDIKRDAVIRESTDGLSKNQAAKLATLAESVDFVDEHSFKEKVVELREAYFAKPKPTKGTIENDAKEPVTLQEKVIDRRERSTVATVETISKFFGKK